MRNILQKVTVFALCAASVAATQVAVQAAPRQFVVVVADGFSPQVIDLGSLYVKKSSTEEEPSAAFDDLKSQGKTAAVGSDPLSAMRGVLKTAAANGYKTGLVTTGDAAADAALLYDLPAATANVAGTLLTTTKPNFLAGGGRANFGSVLTKSYATAGNTTYLNADEFESADTDSIKGNVLALQADGDLNYAIDHDSSVETSVGDLASLAIKTLGGDTNSPYVLVVHDTNLSKALAAKDTPAVFGEFREIDGIVADVLSTRGALDTPDDLALAVISTGAVASPKYTSETPAERSNAIFIASQLTSSYAKTTATLKGATDDDITTFATDTYPGWKPSSSVRSRLVAGTLTGEDAVRASYESAIALGYDSTVVAPMAMVVGLDASDVVKQIADAVSTKVTTAKTATKTK